MNILSKRIFIIGIISFIYIIVFGYQIVQFDNNKDDYFNEGLNELNTQFESSIQSYSYFSEYIYETIVLDEYILQQIDLAYRSDSDTQDEIREDLYLYLEDEYLQMKEYNFRQFHFHFPDSTSFLRMHKPDTFGDDLSNIRYSVATVNKDLVPLTGFEEGRIVNGYRFVYPLFLNEEHIGSVEVSISLSSVIHTLTELYEGDYYFIINKEVVEDKIFTESTDNYRPSIISDDYLIDVDSFDNVETRNLFTNEEYVKYINTITDKEVKKMDSLEQFGIIHDYDSEDYEMLFLPISNVEGDVVVYFISISEVNTYNHLVIQHFLNLFYITAILAFIIVLYLSQKKSKESVELISNTDQLTKIDNRRKFYNDFNNELSRCKRYNTNLSFIMFDIDKFKLVNDNYGHKRGDDVLIEIAKSVKSLLRNEDSFARYGGEEFLIMLVNTDLDKAYAKAELIREEISNISFLEVGTVTISLGVYEITKDISRFDEVFEKLDKAMYNAKIEGRNRTVKYN